MASATAHVVLVHGGWGRPDDWDLVVEQLRAVDIPTTTVDLVTTREASAGLDADIAEVGRVLDQIEGDKVLVGHSYGGMVVTAAAAGRALRRLVYLTAFLPEEDDNAFTLLTSVPSPRSERVLQMNDDGTTSIEPWPLPDAIERFGRAAVDAMAERPRRRQSAVSALAAAPALGWREHPATYILATRDEVLPPTLQRAMARRAAEVREIDTNHFPMFEAPETVAAILVEIATADR